MQRKINSKTLNMIFAALFTAVICVFSQIAIPTPFVPVTLQTFAVCLCGYLLGVRLSCLSVSVYILLGIIGLPVFHGFQGGAQHLLSPTGGFIIGFLPLALCCGASNKIKNNFLKILFGASGILICHAMGILQFSFVSQNSLIISATVVSLPYLLKDIPLCIAALYISKYLKKHL